MDSDLAFIKTYKLTSWVKPDMNALIASIGVTRTIVTGRIDNRKYFYNILQAILFYNQNDKLYNTDEDIL